MMKKSDLRTGWIIVGALIVAAFLSVFPVKIKDGDVSIKSNIHLGLDLKGGMYVLLNADTSNVPEKKRSEAIQGALEKIRNRIDAFGVSEVSIEVQGDNSVLIEIPGMVDRTIIDRLQGVGKLEFKLVDDNQEKLVAAIQGNVPEGYELAKYESSSLLVEKTALITGADLSGSQPAYDMYGRPSIGLQFNTEGAKKFAKVTQEHVGRQLAIILDGKIMSAPSIRTAILDGQGVIEGDFNMDESRALVSVLNSGALPIPLTLAQERTIGPSLGSDSVKKGIRSSVLGVVLVALFMLIYYMVGGIVAVSCVVLNMLFTLAGLNMFHGTLTLPGIAGMILTLGMAVDANVLIYERIREELSLKKPLNIAVKIGFEKAWSAIWDSNLTTLIAAFFLFIFGTGPIKGFATTLSLGIVASMFTAVYVGKLIFALMLHMGLKKFPMLKFFPDSKIDFVKWRNVAMAISAIVIVAGLFTLNARKKTMYGTDFLGGQVLEYKITPAVTIDKVREVLTGEEFSQIAIQDFKDVEGGVRIRCASDLSGKVEAKLKEVFPNVETLNVDTISPKVGKSLKQKAFLAVLLSLLGILLYVAVRFKHFDFAFAGIVALFHDVLIALAAVAFANSSSGLYQIDLLTITAFLTICGFSINDTIVIYDRIREVAPHNHKLGLKGIINLATNQCFSRTIITSFTALLSIAAIYVAGGESLKCFSFTLLVGFVSGVYSTIYIAAPLVIMLRKNHQHVN